MDAALLGAALERFGDALVNTRSTTWRGLDEAELTARVQESVAQLIRS